MSESDPKEVISVTIPEEQNHRFIQRDLEAGVIVWVHTLGAQKRFLVQYNLSSIHSNK